MMEAIRPGSSSPAREETKSSGAPGRDTLSVVDNRTGREYEIPIRYGTYPTYGAAINCLDLKKIKAGLYCIVPFEYRNKEDKTR